MLRWMNCWQSLKWRKWVKFKVHSVSSSNFYVGLGDHVQKVAGAGDGLLQLFGVFRGSREMSF